MITIVIFNFLKFVGRESQNISNYGRESRNISNTFLLGRENRSIPKFGRESRNIMSFGLESQDINRAPQPGVHPNRIKSTVSYFRFRKRKVECYCPIFEFRVNLWRQRNEEDNGKNKI